MPSCLFWSVVPRQNRSTEGWWNCYFPSMAECVPWIPEGGHEWGSKLQDKILALFMAPQVIHLVTFMSHKLFPFFSSSFNNTSCCLPCSNIESRNCIRPADHLEFLRKTHSVAPVITIVMFISFILDSTRNIWRRATWKKWIRSFMSMQLGQLENFCLTSSWNFRMTMKCRLSPISTAYLSSAHTKIGTTQNFHRTSSIWHTHLWTILNYPR